MGDTWSRRPGRFPNGLKINGGSTFGGAVTAAGNVTLGADLILPTEAKTAVAAAISLADHGVSFVTYGTSGGARDVLLPSPPAAGAVKHIFVINNTTSVELKFFTASSSRTFWGSTFNQIQISGASTGSPGGTPAGSLYLGLVGASTSQWAVFPGSTFNWDFSASTGSTAQ
jgi:hypothetical protein